MKSFEGGFKPEANIPEETKFEEIPSIESGKKIDFEELIAQEKSLMEEFRGKARNVAKALILTTALSGGGWLAGKISAEKKQGTVTEEVKKETAINNVSSEVGEIEKNAEKKQTIAEISESEVKLEETNLTESSRWSNNVLDSAKEDFDRIKTKEDAEWLIRSHFNQFVSEFYMPKEGNVREGPYGVPIREYATEDIKLLLKNANELKSLLISLNSKYGVANYSKRQQQLDDMIEKLKRKSSYAGQKQMEALERMEKVLNERGSIY